MEKTRNAACWLACCLPIFLSASNLLFENYPTICVDSCTVVGPAEVKICLPEGPNAAVFVDFSNLVLAGDATGFWEDVDSSGAAGQFPFLDFTHVLPGSYAFSYTVRPTAACPDSLFFVEIKVVDCQCPALSGNKLAPICRADARIPLVDFSKNEPGVWSIAAAPPASTAFISGGAFDATASIAGRYLLAFQFNSVPFPNCPVADSMELTVAQPVFEKMRVAAPNCLGEKNGSISLDSISGGIEPLMFSIENQPFSSSSNFENLPAGTFQLTTEDAAGCQADTLLTLAEPPALTLSAGMDTAGLVGDSLRFLPSANFAVDSFWWSGPGIGRGVWEPKVEIVATSLFKLTALDGHGCRAESSFQVKARRGIPVYFPNAFRPGGGGADGVFKPFARGGINLKIRKMAIRSRWGEVVFSAQNLQVSDAAAGWDGTFRGKTCAAGVYVWSAEIELADGSIEVREGDVTLVGR